MPLPNFNTLCFSIDVEPGNKCISFPGGVQLCANIPTLTPPTGMELIQDLMGKLNTAMAPLQPVFNIIDAVLAVFDCVKAIATLDPEKIAGCIPNLAERVNALLSLVPQLSLPILIRDCVDCLIIYLSSAIGQIQRIMLYQQRIIAASLAAADSDIAIGPVIDCATGNLDKIVLFLGEQATPVNRVIGIINAFLQLLGLPCIPSIGAPNASDAFINVLLKLVEFLQFLRGLLTIPVPTPSLSADSDSC